MPCALQNDAHFFKVLEVERGIFSRSDDFIGAFGADSGHAKQLFDARPVDFDGEILHIPKRPGAFRVVFGGQIFSRRRDFVAGESVKSEQPIGLI